ncbi:reverse transcriptase domain-containing protein [Tanacetum coccineum]|uniref:Reverse transcriptase domain-containing protein n=1 Tax=Tanacetum coccineum TaxID=301880 RepID=A0ABQ5J2K4_9ASTR
MNRSRRRTPDRVRVSKRILLKVSPLKGVVRFGKKGKLAPRFVGPFKITERIDPVAYRLRLPEELNGVHDTFHPVEILEREFKKLKQSRITIVKVRWNSKRGPEFTWERTMAEVDVDTLTMEQYLALSRENQASGVVKPEIESNVNFKIKSQFMRKLREDLSSRIKTRMLTITLMGRKKMGGQTSPRNYQYLGSPQEGIYPKVGCQICEGPHLDKVCPLNKEVKQVEEVRYGEFGRTTLFNGSNGGKFRIGPPGYYTKIDNRPPYAERRQSLEESLANHQEESAQRRTKIEVWIKKLKENAEINIRNQAASLKNLETQIEQLTEELCSRKEKSEEAKVVTVENEGPSSRKKLKNLHRISFLSNSQEENTIDQLPTKESNPGHFTLPCTIDNFNFYAMADLGDSVNVLPRNIFKYLGLRNLSKTEMLVEMADMRKKAPLGIVKDILVKIDKFLFPSDFVILDQTPNSIVILGRPFLATIHAQISVYEKEISVGIGDERVTFNINRNDPNFALVKGIFMLNSVNTDEPITKRLKIRTNVMGGHEIYRINELGETKRLYGGCQLRILFGPKGIQKGGNAKFSCKEPRPRDYTFKEWVKLKKGHLDISKSVRKDLFRLWVIDKSTEALDPDKDPFGRCLDEYNWGIKSLLEDGDIDFHRISNIEAMLGYFEDYYSEDQYAISIKKIRRIRACTHQRPQRNKDQYAVLGINLHKLVLLVQETNINTAKRSQRYVMEFESAHSNTTAKLPILKLGEYEMWVIRIKQYFQVQDYALWEVIENGKRRVSIIVEPSWKIASRPGSTQGFQDYTKPRKFMINP